MKTAHLVRRFKDVQSFQFEKIAGLYWVSAPPLDYDGSVVNCEHIVVSAVIMRVEKEIMETLVFAADAEGKFLTSDELPGSLKGSYDIEKALNAAGYTLSAPLEARFRNLDF